MQSMLRLPSLYSLRFSSSCSSSSSSYSSYSSLKSPILFSFSHLHLHLSSFSTSSPRLRQPFSPPTFLSPPSKSFPSSMVGSPRLQSKVCFSAGGAGRENKEVLVQHLLVDADNLKLLVELHNRIAEGVDLSDLAVEHSLCPSKENGGMLGWIRRGQTVPEFEEAVFTAPINKVVRCKTKFGWHLVQVLSEREESVIQDINPEELHVNLQDPSFVQEAQLIDVREPEEVAQASLPGFKVLPLRQFGTWGPLITDEFDPQKDTYVLCHHGIRSLQVANWLQSQGFKRVFNVAGGIHAYSLKADTSIPTY